MKEPLSTEYGYRIGLYVRRGSLAYWFKWVIEFQPDKVPAKSWLRGHSRPKGWNKKYFGIASYEYRDRDMVVIRFGTWDRCADLVFQVPTS